MKFDITEVRILLSAVLGSAIAPIDMFYRFIIPIASAVTWYFLKPKLNAWQEKRKLKKKQ
ncbi:hypothetical protein [Thalassobellus suaedae]|uniref:Uncharacterized protein n=1 Tax=Thalassobellus suaedae TaxID=3074124 RepID=A0ABY9XVS6_9FLAO|nr:hypothetical protein RHP51_04965 [Flavobacteriaceae bacterium HL-DH14]